jgi:hypothetical protein
MRCPDQTVGSLAELMRVLGDQYAPPKDVVWFRGQADAAWSLTPSIYRAPFRAEHEAMLTTRFKQNALPMLAVRPASSWEWMFLMRHHGCPTRLLDWSESPLVAIYFACGVEGPTECCDAVLWCLSPTTFNAQWGMAGLHENDIPAFGVSPLLEDYSPDRIASNPAMRRQPAAAIAAREAGRMSAQQSVFTVHHTRTDPIESYGDQSHLWRLIIPAARKSVIRQELAVLGVNRLSVFPDLDSVAQIARESISHG